MTEYSELFVFYRRGHPVHIHPDRKVFEGWMEKSAWLYPPAVCEIVRFVPEAQPEYLSGCLHPTECQRLGMCQSQSCKHAGKVVAPRMCVEPKEDGVLYPAKETT